MRIATPLCLLGALLAILVHAVAGPLTSPRLGVGGVGLAFRLDALSVTMTALVVLIGASILRFSRGYLDGDPRQGRFLSRLAVTIATVLLLASSADLIQLVAAWVAGSLVLHRLLIFRDDRPRAILAAKKKFVIARIADVALLGAAILLGWSFGTIDIGAILEGARELRGAAVVPGAVSAAAGLIALAALLKSVQIPAHVWLPETVEAPTPISALLHAGIVNGGGFLVIRFADVMLLAPGALSALLIVGGLTAVAGSLVMTIQTSVKTRLAWSTIAQMGLMIFQCGLGAFAIAALHIVGHSLYKAHAFLASGGAVDALRSRSAGAARRRLAAPGPYSWVSFWQRRSCSASRPPRACASPPIPAPPSSPPSSRWGSPPWSVTPSRRNAAPLRSGVPCSSPSGLALLYAGVTGIVTRLFAGSLPPAPSLDFPRLLIACAVIAALALLSLMQWLAPALSRSERWAAWKVHLRNGLYVNALFDRWLGSIRRLPAPAASRGHDR